jgi:hypothetical protein
VNRLLTHLSSAESVRSERERAALAVAADRGSDAGVGRCLRMVDLPALAAVSGEHALSNIIQGDDSVGGTFSDLCLRRMDGDQGPWESELNLVAMVLLGVASAGLP